MLKKIDTKEHAHLKQVIQLSVGVYLGFQVYEDCTQEFNPKKQWLTSQQTNGSMQCLPSDTT